MIINIKYFNENYPRLEKTKKGDHIDLRVDGVNKHYNLSSGTRDETISNEVLRQDGELEYLKGDVIRFNLGVAMELPEGYEAGILPRSSTFDNWGFIQTNSEGTIDNIYCGDSDQWMVEFLAVRDGSIKLHDRVCQFRIHGNQPGFSLNDVPKLGNKNRDGFGSSGRNEYK